MADRSWLPHGGTLEVNIVQLYGTWSVDSAGEVNGVSGRGVTTVVRNSVGNYTVYLTDIYNRLMWASAVLGNNGAVARIYRNDVSSPIPSITFQFPASTVTAATEIRLEIELRVGSGSTGQDTLVAPPAAPSFINALMHQSAGLTVIGDTAIANSNATTIIGDTASATATGFPPGVIAGTKHVADATWAQAETDLTYAVAFIAGQTHTDVVVGGDLASATWAPGVYDDDGAPASLALADAATMICDAAGNADARFVFRSASTITFGDTSTISLINGAQPGNVIFVAATDVVTTGASVLKGVFIAGGAATLFAGTTVLGRVYTQTDDVTLDTNTITKES